MRQESKTNEETSEAKKQRQLTESASLLLWSDGASIYKPSAALARAAWPSDAPLPAATSDLADTALPPDDASPTSGGHAERTNGR